MIDFNLFGDREPRAANFLRNELKIEKQFVVTPPGDAAAALRSASARGRDGLATTVMLYLSIAAVNLAVDVPGSVQPRDLADIAQIVLSPEFASEIDKAFGEAAIKEWERVSDERLRSGSGLQPEVKK